MADVKTKLMKKTKNELIDIILRKDAIELGLNEKVKNQDAIIKSITDENLENKTDIESYHKEIDDMTEQINVLLHCNTICKFIAAVSIVSAIVLGLTVVYLYSIV